MSGKINSITLNGSSVAFNYGVTIHDVLNKDLNSAVLVIPQSAALTIEPFDEVVITYETTRTLHFLVGTYKKQITKFHDVKNYNYEITLVSPVLKLQRIILPARSITRKISVDSTLTIKQVMERYLDMYMPNMNMTARLNLLTDVPCPEMSWNRPTLFEVFNDLLITLGAVVSMDGFDYIDYLDLSNEGNQIDETYINNYEYERGIDEYASAIEIEAQNVYSENSITSTGPSPINIRNENDIKITTENQQIIVQKPIFTIEKVEAFIYFGINTNGTPYAPIDITSRVVEESVYNLLSSSNSATYEPDTSSNKYRRNYLKFKRGSMAIDGLNFREDNWLAYTDTQPAIVHVIYHAMKDQYGSTYTDANYASYAEQLDEKLYDEIFFKVQYTTTDNVLFRVRKDVKPKHESILINNQSNSFVYANLLGKQQQEFVNRTGNEELTITGRYDNYTDIPNLNDYIDDYKLTEREIAINSKYYLFSGKLSKHYSKDNLFAGINTQKRYTELASTADAFNSNHISEKFYRFGFTDTANDSELFTSYILSNYAEANNNLDGAIVRTKFNDNSYSPFFYLQGTPYVFGHSFVYSVRMYDNVNVAWRLDEGAGLFAAQQLQLVKYTDDFGNFKEIRVQLYSKGGIKDLAFDEPGTTLTANNNFSGPYNFQIAMLEHASKLPIIDTQRTYRRTNTNPPSSDMSDITYNTFDDTKKIHSTGYVKRYKDNREITFETL